MTEQELEWLEKCKNDLNYRIVVDNDSIWIDGVKEDECVFQFNSYGEDFIVDLLNGLGYYAEHC